MVLEEEELLCASLPRLESFVCLRSLGLLATEFRHEGSSLSHVDSCSVVTNRAQSQMGVSQLCVLKNSFLLSSKQEGCPK
jgi:hypothetical protein